MGDAHNHKILVVEDDSSIREVVTEILRQNGFEVITATNGKDGLSIALDQHPSLILLDIIMPELDGLSVLEQLRTDDWGKTVPVIIHTNMNPDADSTMQAIIKHKPAFYLVKAEVSLNDIIIKIKEVLQIA
jgi:DNA-binding response OmpR family regulator